mmetsp:Transcript_5335/g.19214  ORF Transcript_5335/g.19214 Transcript_5335/m.19214 type:complete len:273 (-) Transcript_5335:195-1013(-)
MPPKRSVVHGRVPELVPGQQVLWERGRRREGALLRGGFQAAKEVLRDVDEAEVRGEVQRGPPEIVLQRGGLSGAAVPCDGLNGLHGKILQVSERADADGHVYEGRALAAHARVRALLEQQTQALEGPVQEGDVKRGTPRVVKGVKLILFLVAIAPISVLLLPAEVTVVRVVVIIRAVAVAAVLHLLVPGPVHRGAVLVTNLGLHLALFLLQRRHCLLLLVEAQHLAKLLQVVGLARIVDRVPTPCPRGVHKELLEALHRSTGGQDGLNLTDL